MHFAIDQVILGDCLDVLARWPGEVVDLAYIDPPFNTGKVQQRDRFRATTDQEHGERTGFGGRRYRIERVESGRYQDRFDDYPGFLMPRIEASLRCLTPDGSRLVHLD